MSTTTATITRARPLHRRLDHIRAATLYLVCRWSTEQVCAAMGGIGKRTLFRWCRWAVEYDDPEAGDLRRAMRRRQRGGR